MNRYGPTLLSLFAASLVAGLLSTPVLAQFEDLASKIPASANAIVLLDAERLLSSAISKREGWKESYEKAFASGMVTISPDTKRLILAAEFDYQFMAPQWKLAVADVGRARTAVELARATKGVLDPIGDTPAVALRENAYAIELGPNRVAAFAPANRQTVARWLRETQSRTAPALSNYLKGTLAASRASPIVIAFDLEDAVPPDIIRGALAASPALKAKNIDVDAATKALEGVRGLVLEVAVSDGSYARLMVHFRGDCSILTPIAKPLLQEVLAGLGATIDDIDGWETKSESQRISLNGQLSAAGRKRVFSIIDNPIASLVAAEQSANATIDRENAQAAAVSKQYFEAIESIVNDIRETSKDAKTFGQSAMWFDKWARRIDTLPVLNVDSELVEFGQHVSTQLRDMAASLRGIGIRSGARSAQVWDSSSAYYDGYSYYAESRDGDPQRRAIRAEEKAVGATSARGIAQGLESSLAKIRKDLTQKYNVEF
jgi:hypothetical protein